MSQRFQISISPRSLPGNSGPDPEKLTLLDRLKAVLGAIVLAVLALSILVAAVILGSVIAALVGIALVIAIAAWIVMRAVRRVRP